MPNQRVAALDGVRGIAILLVLSYHAFVWQPPANASALARAVTAASRWGWLGVDLFFVLSGFLITGVLLETRERAGYYRNFYARRALRILPLYYLCVAAIAIVYRGVGRFLIACLLYVPNLAPLIGVPLAYGPLWSLAVEEHFYLVWPLVVRRARRERLVAILAIVCLAEPIARAINFELGSMQRIYTWLRLDGLAWGAMAALLVRGVGREKLAARLAIAGLVALAIGAPLGILDRSRLVGAALEFVPFYLLFAALVVAAAEGRRRGLARALSVRPLRRCGDYSYFLYLFHELGFAIYGRFIPDDRFDRVLERLAIVLPICFVAAALSFRYLERPILGLKRRFEPPARAAA